MRSQGGDNLVPGRRNHSQEGRDNLSQRRVDLSLRHIVQSSYQKSFNSKKTMAEALAEEIYAAYNNDPQNSNSVKDKERIEREAGGAR
jgi:ribosomal protein S7